MRLLDRAASHLNWNLLRTFLVIAEERSITRASERLLLRQPSVSAALRRLEETVGYQLITRDSRRFALTREGEILYRECDEIYRRISGVPGKLAESAGDISGLVKLQVVTHLVWPELDLTLANIHTRHPNITFKIEIASSQDIVLAISQQNAPFGICLLTNPIASLTCRLAFRESFAVFCGPQHCLFGRRDVTDEDLQSEPWVSFSCAEAVGSLEPMIALRGGANLARRVIASSQHLEELRRLIVAGIGIGALPIAPVELDIEKGRLWPIPLPQKDLGADVYIISNPARQFDLAEQVFLDELSAQLSRAQSDPAEAADVNETRTA